MLKTFPRREVRAAAILLFSLAAFLVVVYLTSVPMSLWTGAMAGALLVYVVRHFWVTEDIDAIDVNQLISHVRPGRKLAIIDPQTTLLQRWYFDLRLAEESERCRRHGFQIAVLFVQIDPAAEPNTSYEAPEDTTAQLFVRTIRTGDLAAKIDPRTYALCLMHSDEQNARAAIRRLLGRLQSLESPDIALAMCPPDGSDVASLLAAAQAVDLNEPVALHSRIRRKTQPLGELLTEQAAGEVALKPEETFAQARARVRRASKRAGINVKVWEVDGALRFERVDLPATADVA